MCIDVISINAHTDTLITSTRITHPYTYDTHTHLTSTHTHPYTHYTHIHNTSIYIWHPYTHEIYTHMTPIYTPHPCTITSIYILHPPAPWLSRNLYFPEEIQWLSSSYWGLPKAQILRMRAVPQPHGSPESFIFRTNFNGFPPHTEVHPKLRIRECPLFPSPMALQKPSFS